MIDLDVEAIATPVKGYQSGQRFQDLLESLSEKDASALAELVRNTDSKIEGLARRLRAQLAQTEFHNMGYKSLTSWRDNPHFHKADS